MLEVKPITEKDAERLWKIGFSAENPEWAKWNAPYFEEYVPYTLSDFLEKVTFYKSENNLGIYVDDKLIGVLFRHWENQKTRWLEVGIVIYDENMWSKGYATEALALWLDKTFADFPELEHIGLTTWSGNLGMIKVSEKLGMQQEACIRKVRYWQGVYYDSVKYGILRDEWESMRKGKD